MRSLFIGDTINRDREAEIRKWNLRGCRRFTAPQSEFESILVLTGDRDDDAEIVKCQAVRPPH